MEVKNSFIIVFVLFFIISCKNKKDESHVKNIEAISISNQAYKLDSIVYELPTQTVNKIANLILLNKNIDHCSIVSCSMNNLYYLSFPYNNKTKYTKKDSILFQTTNRYLKIKDKYYPIVFDSDYDFFDLKEDEKYTVINDFNFVSFALDARGNIKNSD